MKDPSAKRKTVQKKYDQTWKGTNVEKSESNRKEKTTGNETRTEDRTDRASREKTEEIFNFLFRKLREAAATTRSTNHSRPAPSPGTS